MHKARFIRSFIFFSQFFLHTHPRFFLSVFFWLLLPFYNSLNQAMDITQIYVIIISEIFCTSVLLNCRHSIVCFWEQISFCIFKYSTYFYLIRRHQFLGSWTSSIVLTQRVFIVMNAFYLGFWTDSYVETANRVGTLSLVNSFLFYVGSHLSFLADLTSMSISAYKFVHWSTDLMSFVFALFHVICMIKTRSFFVDESKNLFVLMISSLSLLSPNRG